MRQQLFILWNYISVPSFSSFPSHLSWFLSYMRNVSTFLTSFLWSLDSLHLYSKIIRKGWCSLFSSALTCLQSLQLKVESPAWSHCSSVQMLKTAIKYSTPWGKKGEEGIGISPWQLTCFVLGVHRDEHGCDTVQCNMITMGRHILSREEMIVKNQAIIYLVLPQNEKINK